MIGQIVFDVFDEAQILLPGFVSNCSICSAEHVTTCWLPMYEDKIIDTIFATDDEYAWMPVCEKCCASHDRVAARLSLTIGGISYVCKNSKGE